jgi:hypothetical protein
MTSHETIKELYPKINALLGELDEEVKGQVKKIKKEVNTKIIEAKIQLLKIICMGEDLDFGEICDKYLPDKEKKHIKIYDSPDLVNETLLDSIIIDNKNYFYENKDNGFIFNTKSEKVGKYINGVPVMN